VVRVSAPGDERGADDVRTALYPGLEGLLVADVHPAALAASRRADTHLADRRPELHGALTATSRETA
jgi:hypothetical protein